MLRSHFEHIRVQQDGPVITVTIARSEHRNSFVVGLQRELLEVAQQLRRRTDVHAVILGADPPCFSVGADLGSVEERSSAGSLLEKRGLLSLGPDMVAAWEAIEPVTIAAIEGHCIGAGCALILGCDFRILGEGASLRLPEVSIGLAMGWNTLPRLARLVGPARAKRMAMFGEAVPAAQCLEWGLADQLAGGGEALDIARGWASRISELPPIATRMAKEAVNAWATAHFQLASYMDRDQLLLTSDGSDVKEGIAAFRERRKPHFKGD